MDAGTEIALVISGASLVVSISSIGVAVWTTKKTIPPIRDQAKAAWAGVEEARVARLEAAKPRLAVEVFETGVAFGDNKAPTVRVRNVGQGPALRVECRIQTVHGIYREPRPQTTIPGNASGDFAFEPIVWAGQSMVLLDYVDSDGKPHDERFPFTVDEHTHIWTPA